MPIEKTPLFVRLPRQQTAALERIAGAIREALASAEGIRILDEGEAHT